MAQPGMDPVKTVRPGIGRPLLLEEFSLHDLEAVRLLLRGDSVIDWHKLGFVDHGAVDRFLRINEFDPDSADEMARLEELRIEAVDYLNRVFQLPIPDEVAYEVPARDLFLMASRNGKNRRWACVVLKLVHICNHLAGREIMRRLPIADDDVFRATELKVIQVVEALRAAGYPITEFEWSRKQRDSLVTKLLAKRSTLAAKVYDKLRFRLTVPRHEDLMPMLAMLTRQLIPFNYVVPGESVNHLVSLETAIDNSQNLSSLRPRLQSDGARGNGRSDGRGNGRSNGRGRRSVGLNEFSGPDYRIINFIADLPLRIESLELTRTPPPEYSHVVFVLTEFQLTDAQTARLNDQGESSHANYKARQHDKVRDRLMRDDGGGS